jgi:hypothetical protein
LYCASKIVESAGNLGGCAERGEWLGFFQGRAGLDSRLEAAKWQPA